MTTPANTPWVELVPVDRISVLNPRERDKKKFAEIVDSISRVGLKKPITVNRSARRNGPETYELVCGQGRLEAFIQLGQPKIPAIVIDVSQEDRLIMSLVENLARRQHKHVELLRDIGDLKKRGYTDSEIAKKTGLSYKYVHSIAFLLDQGEERLLVAVETGKIPLNVAIEIAETGVEGAQEALAQAYEEGLLKGKKLLIAKRVLEQRRRLGKADRALGRKNSCPRVSSEALVRAYEREADRLRLMIRNAELTRNRLLFVVEAMRTLLADENFATLLRAENLSTLPKPLAELVKTQGEV